MTQIPPRPPLPRTPFDDLQDYYASLPKGTPVVGPQHEADDAAYYERAETVDRGRTPARKMIVADENGAESLTLVYDSTDPIVREVTARHAATMSDPNMTADRRRTLHLAILREISDLQSARDRAAAQPTPIQSSATQPTFSPVPLDVRALGADARQPTPPDVLAAMGRGSGPAPIPVSMNPATNPVANPAAEPAAEPPRRQGATFVVGGMGSHQAVYDHIQISNVTLLLASRQGDTRGYYVPPPVPVDVRVEGLPDPVRAVLVDVYEFNGYAHVVMVIDRAAE